MRQCRARIQSDSGTEYCEGRSGHRTHWYKIYNGRGEYYKETWRNKNYRAKEPGGTKETR